MQSKIAGLVIATVALVSGTDVFASPARTSFERDRAELASIEKALQMGAATDVIFVHDFDPGAASSCSNDRDADRLSDCVETATGRYVSRTDTGTSPDSADTDGDGLLDGDEVLGTAEGLDLPALGTSALRRDVLLEYDWFDYAGECGQVSHRPSAGAIARVSAMFAAAPVSNPDGSTGVNVIHDFGQGGAHAGGNLVTGYSAVIEGALDLQYYQIKQKNFDPKRLGYFHYVLMAHRYNGGANSSGYAEIIGDDMIVTLHCSRSDVNVGNTIAHELGHNLGLDHGGFEPCNDKPNYNSIMNYRYQFAGVDAACVASGSNSTANFSRGDRLPLDEAALNEPQGVCGTQPIDWNRDGSMQAALAHDLNASQNGTCGTAALTRLEDFDDWRNLTYAGVLDKHGLLKNVQRKTGCAGAPAPAGK
ncbi:MAG TPA: hypothetical protein VND91_10385 [Candidatus Saccharimonadia bacterium]|nr:hypothetical protein [Candidatus Saccharimonadia bacterium]